jgi:hypothetical protein
VIKAELEDVAISPEAKRLRTTYFAKLNTGVPPDQIDLCSDEEPEVLLHNIYTYLYIYRF